MDRWKVGIRCFNNGDYWKAHEEWEQVWKTLPSPERNWLQGLIQASAVFYLLEKNRPSPARRLCLRALEKLEGWPRTRSALPKITVKGLKPLLKKLEKAIADEDREKIKKALGEARSLRALLKN